MEQRSRAKRRAEAAEHRPKLNNEDAADYCGLSASTMRKYRVFGGGPSFFKLGRRVVYDPDDLDRWLEAQRRVSTSDRGAAALAR